MTQRFPLAARLWRVLSRALNKPITPKAPATDVTSEIPSAGIQIPEEGANRDYASFYRVSLGDKFNDERYIVLRKLGYGQYSTVWLARDSR